ncbi:hypothetical protein CKM354_001290200 [Cercospora kikuchii]|uniref:Uncharacterized protein n=1 Tax=Cercospora kikuchii TaxID=84275 RepID=A0A9P3L277_9PEZI|nr:uncharacterized protein CKM354_001290200 [Cercospora kikuchii]GIZ49885.1 hypothetical protein CKM354_001290200 [Cercospora kikuchii]
MPVNWDDAKERQLLLAIISANPSGTEDYIGDALRQKFAKLKKNATDQYGDFGAAASSAPTPAKKTTKRKSANKAAEDKEDGEEDSAAPKIKKAKTTKKSASAADFSGAIATTKMVSLRASRRHRGLCRQRSSSEVRKDEEGV